ALFAPDADPDHWVDRLLDEGRELLAPSGALLVELGANQSPRAARLARERGWSAHFQRDLAGIERVLEAKRAETTSTNASRLQASSTGASTEISIPGTSSTEPLRPGAAQSEPRD